MTLIELLVTITIMGIVFVIFVGGVGLAIRASDQHKRVVTADTVLRNAAEELQRLPYASCATHYDLTTPPVDGSAPTAIVRGYLDNAADASFVASCSSSPDGGAQLVEITVSSAGATRPVRDEVLQVVKRR